MCSPCWQRHPDRPFIRAQGIKTRLVDSPAWFDEFIGYLAVRHCPARACVFISALGRLLEDAEPNHPQALLEHARRPGRSMGTLARSLEDFFTGRRLALRTDQEDRLAAGRRQRRVDAAPAELRPAIAAFTESMLRCRERARRAGTRPAATTPWRPRWPSSVTWPVSSPRSGTDATGRWWTCTTSKRSSAPCRWLASGG